MGNSDSTRDIKVAAALGNDLEEQFTEISAAYIRRLIVERPRIRAALYNHGGSVILQGASLNLEAQDDYSSQLGNDLHLDLLIVEETIVVDLSKGQRDALIAWGEGLEKEDADETMRAKPAALRKRKQRNVEQLVTKLVDRMSDGGQDL